MSYMFIEEWVYQRFLRELQESTGPTVLGIPFYKVESPVFSKTDMELVAYNMPITKILEDNSVKEIADLEHKRIMSLFKDLFEKE